MPYWKRARAWARDHTETYSLNKAAPAVVIALLQYLFSSGSVFQKTLISIGLILLSYLLLLALEFLWKMLIAAPVALDAEHAVNTTRLESKIRDLDERLEAPKVPELERSRRDLVRSKLKDCTPDDFAVLKYILQNGQADVGAIIALGVPDPPHQPHNPDAYRAAIDKAFSSGLLKLSSPGSSVMTINPDLVDALSFHLLTH